MGAHIMARAKIGANATLLPGVTIGENALVGAGAVLTRRVPARTIAKVKTTVQFRERTDL